MLQAVDTSSPSARGAGGQDGHEEPAPEAGVAGALRRWLPVWTLLGGLLLAGTMAWLMRYFASRQGPLSADAVGLETPVVAALSVAGVLAYARWQRRRNSRPATKGHDVKGQPAPGDAGYDAPTAPALRLVK